MHSSFSSFSAWHEFWVISIYPIILAHHWFAFAEFLQKRKALAFHSKCNYIMNFPSKTHSSCYISEYYTKSMFNPPPCQILRISVLSELRILSLRGSQAFCQSLIYLLLMSALHLWHRSGSIDISNLFQGCIFWRSYILVHYNVVAHIIIILLGKKKKPRYFILIWWAFLFLPQIIFRFLFPEKMKICVSWFSWNSVRSTNIRSLETSQYQKFFL